MKHKKQKLKKLSKTPVKTPVKNKTIKNRIKENSYSSCYPFQKKGVKFAENVLTIRHGVMFGDEMGLGKTIQALAYFERNHKRGRLLVITQSSVRVKWKMEFEKWIPHNKKSIQIVDSGHQMISEQAHIIITYDLCRNEFIHQQLLDQVFDVIVIDEFHFLGSLEAKRTRSILGYTDLNTEEIKKGVIHSSKKRIFLSGTPIRGRFQEFYPVLARIIPDILKKHRVDSFTKFKQKFAALQKVEKADKIVYSGDVRTELESEFREILGHVMIRRLKKQVLKELPDKTYDIFPIEVNSKLKKLQKQEKMLSDKDFDKFVKYLEKKGSIDLDSMETNDRAYQMPQLMEEIATIRKEIGVEKAKIYLPEIKEVIEQTGKLVIGYWHVEVGDYLEEKLRDYRPLRISGKTKFDKRYEYAEKFQKYKKRPVILTQIIAGGVGYELFAASTALLIEMWFNPGDVFQWVDRLHRIGQTKNVLIKIPILEGSYDERIYKILENKKINYERLLDYKGGINNQ